MRIKLVLAASVVLTLPVFFSNWRVGADGPFLSRLHQHGGGHCPAEHEVVRIPGREIHIETARPRVIVSDVTRSSRMRGYFPAGNAMMMPVLHGGPMFATILPMNVNTHGVSAGADTSSLDSIHALERHTLAIHQERAARQAGLNAADEALERVRGSLNKLSPSGNPTRGAGADADLLNQLKIMNDRMTKIETLLLIHDKALKEITPNVVPK